MLFSAEKKITPVSISTITVWEPLPANGHGLQIHGLKPPLALFLCYFPQDCSGIHLIIIFLPNIVV